jgi:hypothetical protein
MARRPAAPSYAHMTLGPPVLDDSKPVLQTSSRDLADSITAVGTLKESSAHLMLYLHPAAVKALQRYALDQSSPRNKVKVHDLILEALEDWFRRHGLREPVRAASARNRKLHESSHNFNEGRA